MGPPAGEQIAVSSPSEKYFVIWVSEYIFNDQVLP